MYVKMIKIKMIKIKIIKMKIKIGKHFSSFLYPFSSRAPEGRV